MQWLAAQTDLAGLLSPPACTPPAAVRGVGSMKELAALRGCSLGFAKRIAAQHRANPRRLQAVLHAIRRQSCVVDNAVPPAGEHRRSPPFTAVGTLW